MFDFLFFLTSAIGTTIIISIGSIFKPMRDSFPNNKLIRCPMCLGFWVGVILYFAHFQSLSVLMLFTAGTTVSLFSWIFAMLGMSLEKYAHKED